MTDELWSGHYTVLSGLLILSSIFAWVSDVHFTLQFPSNIHRHINPSVIQTKWFQENSLSLNLCKTHLIQFSSKNQNYLDIAIVHRNGLILKTNEIKFLGLHINNTLSWTTHINNILPKLSSACYAMRSVKSYVSQQMLKVIYYSYLHSIMSYGIIFWGHSAGGMRVLRLQKWIISFMMGF